MFKKFSAILATSLICFSFTNQALAGQHLEGNWQHDGKKTTISKDAYNQYLFCSEANQCANGHKSDYKTITVPNWGVTGTVSKGVIYWSNGTQWRKSHERRESIAGSWFHNNRPTSIHLAADRVHFVLINEQGQKTQGYIQDRKQLVLPSANVIGRITQHGRVIQWSNNTTWNR